MHYEIVSENALISEAIARDKELRIYYRGDFVRDVRLVVIRVTNTGRQPILAVDFEQPLSLDFGQNARILSAEKAESLPAEFDLRFRTGDSSIEFEPSLINPRDRIDIKFLIEGEKINVSAKARIAGVKSVEFSKKKDRRQTFVQSLMDILFGPFLFAYGVYWITTYEQDTWIGYMIMIVGALGLFALLLKLWDPFGARYRT